MSLSYYDLHHSFNLESDVCVSFTINLQNNKVILQLAESEVVTKSISIHPSIVAAERERTILKFNILVPFR